MRKKQNMEESGPVVSLGGSGGSQETNLSLKMMDYLSSFLFSG